MPKYLTRSSKGKILLSKNNVGTTSLRRNLQNLMAFVFSGENLKPLALAHETEEFIASWIFWQASTAVDLLQITA